MSTTTTKIARLNASNAATFLRVAAFFIIMAFTSSCATVFSPAADSCQKTKPAAGAQARKVRMGYLLLDLALAPLTLPIDFANNRIYKPCTDTKK